MVSGRSSALHVRVGILLSSEGRRGQKAEEGWVIPGLPSSCPACLLSWDICLLLPLDKRYPIGSLGSWASRLGWNDATGFRGSQAGGQEMVGWWDFSTSTIM